MKKREKKPRVSNSALRRGLSENYLLFVERFWLEIEPDTEYLPNWHIKYLAGILQEEIERIARGEPKKGDLIINIPPRSMKSYLVSMMLQPWAWTRWPGMKFITTSYNAALASDHAMQSRRIILTPLYQSLWGNVFKFRDDVARSTWFENDKGGVRKTAGTKGGITGKGCDCLPYWVKIETEEGPKSIGEIFKEGGSPMVWSFNHSTGERELSKVVAMRRVVKNGLIKIRTRSGGELDCTPDHGLFTEGRYREAAICERGQTSIFFKAGKVRGLWERMRAALKGMPGVLREIATGHRKSHMHEMREGNQAIEIRGGQGKAQRSKWCLLQRAMRKRLSGGPSRASMQTVREDDNEEQEEMVLLGGMQAEQAKQGDKKNLRRMRAPLHCSIGQADLLRKELCEQGTREEDDRSGELSHEEINKPDLVLQGYQEIHQGAGRDEVPSLRGIEQAHSPSRRWGLQKQRHGEHGHGLRFVPSVASSFENDAISSVERISDGEHEVYDLQVAGNNNFFAGGILVHNCLIADDPINPVEISDTAMDEAARWWDEVAYPRLNNLSVGVRIIVGQRVGERDLSAHEREKASKMRKPVRHISFPVETGWPIEPPEHEKNYRDGLLWPERFPKDVLEDMRVGMGTVGYSNQMGQSPTPRGGLIFKKDWFDRYKPETLKIETMTVTQSWDLAFKGEEGSALCAGQTWARKGALHYLLPGAVARQMEYTEQKRAVRALAEAWPQAGIKLLEDAANAQAALSDLKSEIPGLITLPKRAGKIEAATACAPMCEAHQVFVPEGREGDEFIAHMTTFPRGKYKDVVDAATLYLNWARGRGGGATTFEAVDDNDRDREKEF